MVDHSEEIMYIAAIAFGRDISLFLRTPEISLHNFCLHDLLKRNQPFTCSCYNSVHQRK